MNKKFSILIWFSLQFVAMGPIGNKPALVKIMAWRGTGDKPLPESMLTWLVDAYMFGFGGGDLIY